MTSELTATLAFYGALLVAKTLFMAIMTAKTRMSKKVNGLVS
jgi:hypothetical protein